MPSQTPQIEGSHRPVPSACAPPIVSLRGLSKSYLEGSHLRPVLEEAHAEIRRGELVALLGRSGSGKTTLLNLLSGIDLPDSGEVEIAGTRLSALSEEERTLFRRDHIGFVFQFFNLLPTLTVLENLLLPLELKGIFGGNAREAALALLADVRLGERADAFPDRLSGGEQQRVAVARALVHEPDLVLADEPTGNLDHETGAEVLDLLDRLTRRRGKTLVMVTHSREVARLADRILTIRNHQIVEEPPPADTPSGASP